MKALFAAVIALGFAASLGAQPAVATFDAYRGYPLTPGDWRYIATPAGGEARFGDSFVIRCERATRLVLLQRIAAPGTILSALTVTTDTTLRSFAGTSVRIAARDPLLDAISFSRGRFVVSGGGGAALILPSWPEAARSIEDCRN